MTTDTERVLAEVLAVLDAQDAAATADGRSSAHLATLPGLADWWAARAGEHEQRAAAIARLRDCGWTATQHGVVRQLIVIAQVACVERAADARREARACRREAGLDASVTADA